MNISVHTDGASRGNPGQAAIAFVIEGLPQGRVDYKKSIGIYSNNQAEYRAMVAVLEQLVELDINNSEIIFRADSELMVKQIKGEYRVKDANLRPLYDRVMNCINSLKGSGNQLQFIAVRRELNQEADRLANEALDEK